MNTGGFPGRRVATRIRAAAASPFGLSEPASGSEWPVVPWRGVCPRDIAISAIAALDCAFRRPRRLQPTTLPVAALWMAASYHRVTRATRSFLLARSLLRLARRPILAPVTTRFALIRTRNAGRAVTGGNRVRPGREPSQLAQAPVDHATPSPLAVSDDTHATRSLPSLSQSARRARASRADRPNTRQADSALDPLRAPDRRDSTERELRNSREKRHGPADHRESHQAVHRPQHPPRRPRGRSAPRGRPRHRPMRGRNRRNAAMARRPRVKTPAAAPEAASAACHFPFRGNCSGPPAGE